MAFENVNIGSTANDGTGDPLRTAGAKINANFNKAVEGPTSSSDGTLSSFDGTTGKLLQDSGVFASNVAQGAASSSDGDFVAFSGTGGKLLKVNSFAMGAIAHGNDINAIRPAGLFVYWYGTVPPENAVDGDLWMDASA